MVALEAALGSHGLAVGVSRRGGNAGSIEQHVAGVAGSAVAGLHRVGFAVGVDRSASVLGEVEPIGAKDADPCLD